MELTSCSQIKIKKITSKDVCFLFALMNNSFILERLNEVPTTKDDWSNPNTSSPWKFVDKKSNPFSDANTNNKCSSSRPIYVGFPSDVKPESLSSCLKTNQININKEELKKVNDTDFIKFCETKLDTVVNTFNAAKELRTKMRKELESNVNREILQDFKTLVNITDNPLVNSEKINILTNLLCKYANKFKD